MSRVKVLAGLTIGVAATGLFTVAARAYSTSAYKWAVNPVVVYVNPQNADVASTAAETAVQSALNTWSTQSGSSFRFQYGGRVSDTSTSVDGRNVVIFRNTAGSGAIATTYSWWSGGSRIDSDVIFWDADWRFFTGASGCSDGAYVEDVATHELGHSLGLGHSSVTDATMYSTYSRCSTSMRTPAADDITGLQALYPGSGGSTNTAPTVAISAPSHGSSVAQGTAFTFSGSASDTQDGTLTSSLVWTSNLDGQIGTGSGFSRALSVGTHTVTARAVDSGGLSTSKQVGVTVLASTNTAPGITILSPVNGTSVVQGTATTFSGSATDAEDGTLTASLVWTSSLDGQIGTGTGFSRTLSVGSHTITAKVVDSGALFTSKQVGVTVTAPSNTAPTVTITAPSSGTSVVQGTAITFAGSASDTQDGTLTSSLVWTSSLDGQIGTGTGFSRSLSVGSHTVTAKVVDRGGLSGSKQVSVTVTAPLSSDNPTLTARGYKVKGQHTIDLKWTGITSSRADVYRNGSRVVSTANTGQYTDATGERGGGSYTYKVCDEGTNRCSSAVVVTY
jgi:hypothetical protein